MTPKPPDNADVSTELPLGWQLEPPPIDAAVVCRVAQLPRLAVSFSAWLELPPHHVRGSARGWNDDPTPLVRRHISGPGSDPAGRYQALLLTLHTTRRAAEEAAAARAIGVGPSVHRAIIGVEATALEVADARALEDDGLTNRLAMQRDVRAWELLRAIRDNGADAAWIANSFGSEQALVVFLDSLGETLYVRNEAIFRFDADGGVEHLRDVETFKYAANRQFADELSHLLGDTISEVDERIVRRAARIAAAELAWGKRLGTVLLSKSDAAIALDTAEKGVASLVRGGKLIALVHNGEPRFPAWQFAHDFDVDARAALAQAHQLYVATAGVSPWSAASWLIAEHPELNGESPVRWITLGEDREQLRRVAERDAARATR